MPWRTAPAWPRRAAAVDADAEVVLAVEPGLFERRERELLVQQPREVLLDRLAVDPRRAVAGAQDHARDRRLALAGAEVLGGLGISPPPQAASEPAPRAGAPGRRRSSASSAAARASLLRGSMPLTALRSTSVGCRVELLAQRALLEAAGIAGVPVVHLVVELVARDRDLLGVDDDDEVAGVDVRRVLRLALAAQPSAICVASRPRVFPSASTRYQSRVISPGLAL